MKRLVIDLPDELHDLLLEEATRRRVALQDLVRRKLWEEFDPILGVAGSASGGLSLTENLDEELYDLQLADFFLAESVTRSSRPPRN